MENELGKCFTKVFTSIKCFYKPKSLYRCDYFAFISTRTWMSHFALEDMCLRVGLLLLYLILVPLLIDGDNEFGNVCYELIAFSFPQCLHTHLEVFNQDFLRRGGEGITN